MPELFYADRPMGRAMEDAVNEYSWRTPDGVKIWCPYLRNGGPCLPESASLNKPGGGKPTAQEFQSAAAYAYQQLPEDIATNRMLVAEAVRTSLVDGSLADNEHNYTGIDCSGFVVQSLAKALSMQGVDFYNNLQVPLATVLRFIKSNAPDYSQAALQHLYEISKGGSVGFMDYLDIVAPSSSTNPARRVNSSLLFANTIRVVDGRIRPGDIIEFASDRNAYIASLHPALVLSYRNDAMVKLADSSRIDEYAGAGGVEIFFAENRRLIASDYHDELGYPTIRRLAMLANAENLEVYED